MLDTATPPHRHTDTDPPPRHADGRRLPRGHRPHGRIGHAGTGLGADGGAGEDPLDMGRRRAAGTEGAFSHRNATLFEAEGRPVAALVG